MGPAQPSPTDPTLDGRSAAVCVISLSSTLEICRFRGAFRLSGRSMSKSSMKRAESAELDRKSPPLPGRVHVGPGYVGPGPRRAGSTSGRVHVGPGPRRAGLHRAGSTSGRVHVGPGPRRAGLHRAGSTTDRSTSLRPLGPASRLAGSTRPHPPSIPRPTPGWPAQRPSWPPAPRRTPPPATGPRAAWSG